MRRRKARKRRHLRARHALVGLPRPSTVIARPAGTRLTAREREIANLLGLGLTNKEIAVRLGISQRTADTHVQNMLNKLGASNRAQIVALSSAQVTSQGAAAPTHLPTPTPLRRPRSFGRIAALATGGLITVLLLSADGQARPLATGADGELADPYAEGDVNTSIWDVAAGPHLAVFEGGGHLSVYVGADAGNLFEA